MSRILFTGFPGFLGSALLPRVLTRSTAVTTCLVQPKYMELAHRRVEEIAGSYPELAGGIQLVEGDITDRALGLDDANALSGETSEVFHLAAAYDLDVSREVATRVNVEGTRNVLSFAARCPNLSRFHYLSTCYVSGRHRGVYTEEDLDVGQSFNNPYEETKYLAEQHVRAYAEDGLPITIYRPAIAVGDSRTGATQKYDGPYFFIRWILRQRGRSAFLPVVGNPAATRVNVVPRDFVVDAIAYLSGLGESRDRVYHLADPEPLSVREWIDELARVLDRRIFSVRLPRWLLKVGISWIPGLRSAAAMPAEAIDYLAHPTRYATHNAERDLKGSGISVPPVADYLDRLVDFMRNNREAGLGPMY